MLQVIFIILSLRRNHAEEEQKRTKSRQESAEKAYTAEIEHLKQQNSSQKIRIDSLNHQVRTSLFIFF